ncbi:hypothetical protein J2129_001263 [Methanofollis sp. W23]|nr:hypothetical protein [Methanofollis sp. W23]
MHGCAPTEVKIFPPCLALSSGGKGGRVLGCPQGNPSLPPHQERGGRHFLLHALECASLPETLNALFHRGAGRPPDPPPMKIGGGSHPVFTIIALPSRPNCNPGGPGAQSPGAVVWEGMNAWVRNKKRRIFSPHPLLSSERGRTEEFRDDLKYKFLKIPAQTDLISPGWIRVSSPLFRAIIHARKNIYFHGMEWFLFSENR